MKDRKTERKKDRKTERQKDRKTERQKDRKTERQKDRKSERQKDRKTERQNTQEVYNDREELRLASVHSVQSVYIVYKPERTTSLQARVQCREI